MRNATDKLRILLRPLVLRRLGMPEEQVRTAIKKTWPLNTILDWEPEKTSATNGSSAGEDD